VARRKDWYRLNDIRTAARCRDMEIWVPKTGIAPEPDRMRRYVKNVGETPRRTSVQ
jgi:hypothetical protein